MSMPQQHPSTSKQDYETPSDFLEAVRVRFGDLEVDLACSAPTQTDMFLTDNRKAPIALHWPAVDALAIPWDAYGDSLCWLNPPFKRCNDFAEKCAAEVKRFTSRGRIFMLTPASVASNWFSDHVFKKAYVMTLQPRLVFVGEKDPFSKDLMLTIFCRDAEELIATRNEEARDWFSIWRWKPNVSSRRGRVVEDIDAL